MYWLPKTQVLDDPYFEEINIEVDFDKYQKMDTFPLKGGTIGRTLYEHQKEGVKFLLSRDGCILADDMGLGKTVISIVAALESGAEKILSVHHHLKSTGNVKLIISVHKLRLFTVETGKLRNLQLLITIS